MGLVHLPHALRPASLARFAFTSLRAQTSAQAWTGVPKSFISEWYTKKTGRLGGTFPWPRDSQIYHPQSLVDPPDSLLRDEREADSVRMMLSQGSATTDSISQKISKSDPIGSASTNTSGDASELHGRAFWRVINTRAGVGNLRCTLHLTWLSRFWAALNSLSRSSTWNLYHIVGTCR
ncbi:hypothetical protein B0H13DRAFT_889183 [Mycena leptocephala]|nr:hypothetical protein B0H13DRAFT_889183 [Mycena leptocephala]